MPDQRAIWGVVSLVLVSLVGCAGRQVPPPGPAAPASRGGEEEWPAYARDPGGMRHSPLTQIQRGNVGALQVAWTFRTGELATYAGTRSPVGSRRGSIRPHGRVSRATAQSSSAPSTAA